MTNSGVSGTPLPFFRWERGETYFTNTDIRLGYYKNIPCPPNLREINNLFESFLNRFTGNRELVKELAKSNISPFRPEPYLPRSAQFENNGFYVRVEFHELLIKLWEAQLARFVSGLTESRSNNSQN